MQIIIDISEEIYERCREHELHCGEAEVLEGVVATGTPLPGGCGRLFSETEILKFLKCPKYESCDWKICLDCNESRCINLNNVNDLVPIVETDKGGSEGRYERSGS